MKKANIILAIAVAVVIAAFSAVFISDRIALKRAYEKYPTAYLSEIRTASEEFELDPYYVLSIIRCESSFDHEAVSKKGAVGLMQIMPDTGEWIAHKLGMDGLYTQEMLYDPATNIRIGCWYLRFIKGRVGDDLKTDAAAYNAGHGTVQSWLAEPQYSEDGYSLISIPYPETERYVKRVTEAYEQYQKLYPDCFAAEPVED